jgi:hypothetical protein
MYSTDIKAPLLVSNQQVRPKELLPNGEYLPRELDIKLLNLNLLKVVYSEKLEGPGSWLSLNISLAQQPSRLFAF